MSAPARPDHRHAGARDARRVGDHGRVADPHAGDVGDRVLRPGRQLAGAKAEHAEPRARHPRLPAPAAARRLGSTRPRDPRASPRPPRWERGEAPPRSGGRASGTRPSATSIWAFTGSRRPALFLWSQQVRAEAPPSPPHHREIILERRRGRARRRGPRHKGHRATDARDLLRSRARPSAVRTDGDARRARHMPTSIGVRTCGGWWRRAPRSSRCSRRTPSTSSISRARSTSRFGRSIEA